MTGRRSAVKAIGGSLPKTVIGALVASITVCIPGQVSGHAPLRGASPTANTNLGSAPASVQLLVGEPGIGAAPDDYVHVYDSASRDHVSSVSAATRTNDSLVTAPLTGVVPGWYVVHWNIASDDGHPIGGENGSWWAFGVKGVSKKATTRNLVMRNAAPPAGLVKSFKTSVNGLRTGLRTIGVPLKWGTVVLASWTVLDAADPVFEGARFVWGVKCAKSTCTATGIVPRPANYRIDLQVRAKTKSGTAVSVWSTTVTVS